MKKYNVCMPIELEFERRANEIRTRKKNRMLAGLEPIKSFSSAPGSSDRPQNDFSDDEPIPYHLTPLGVDVVENGIVVAVIHSIKELKSYEDWRKRMGKRVRESTEKNRNIDIQRKSKQLSIFEKERGDT